MPFITKVYGIPGSGKTEWLLRQFEEEVRTVDPRRVAFVTFTRSAAEEARRRTDHEELPYLRTIHSICFQQLGLNKNQVPGRQDFRKFGELVGYPVKGYTDPLAMTDEDHYDTPQLELGDHVLRYHHLASHRQVPLERVVEDLNLKLCRHVLEAYGKWKKLEYLFDYTDFLTEYLENGEPLPIDVMFVDEAQDLSPLQWRVVRKLGALAQRWYVAGDDDQAIFTWAGASAKAFNDLESDLVVLLEKSHRVPWSIYERAERVISPVRSRQKKKFVPRDAEGVDLPLVNLEDYYLDHETLVLFRNNYRGILLQQQLMKRGVPFLGKLSVLGQDSVRNAISGYLRHHDLTPAEVKAVHRYSHPSLLRHPKPSKHATSVADLLQATRERWYETLTELPCLPYLIDCYRRHGFGGMLNPRVTVSSIHRSKGHQAHTVVVDPVLSNRTWIQRDSDDERRVWYVALTRAQERLFRLMPQEPGYFDL